MPELADRLRRAAPWLVDGGLAVGFATIAVLTSVVGWNDGYAGSAPDALSAVVGALAPLPLVLRRRHPLLALALVVLLRGLPQLFADIDRPFLGGLIVVVVAFAACAQYAARPWNVLAILLPGALFAEYAALDRHFLDPSEWVFELVLFSIAFAIGTVFRVLRARTTALERELAAVRRTEELRRATRIAAERESIARDLHDVIAHSVSAMVVQAGSARLLLPTSPAATTEALLEVESTGRATLAELRRALGLLRAEGDAVAGAR